MKEQLLDAIGHTQSLLGGIHRMNRRDLGSVNADRFIPILLAVSPAVFAAFALGGIGRWVLDEIGRQVRIREKRPDSPSLRGKPTSKDLEAAWTDTPRSLGTCLRLGSRLADLDPTLDHSLEYTTLPCGKKLIRSRKGGMKGWLSDHRVKVPYPTVMRYKKLAQRLRQALSMDDRLPLEWVLDGLPAGQTLPSNLAAPFASARRHLSTILENNRTLAALSRTVEKKLGIARMVVVSKARWGNSKHRAKYGKKNDFSIISHGHRANVSPGRLKATKEAMARVLKAKRPGGAALHLQNRIKIWLSGLEKVTGT